MNIANNNPVMYQLVMHNNNDDNYFTISPGVNGGLYCNVNIPAQTILMTVPVQQLQEAAKIRSTAGDSGLHLLRNQLSESPHYIALCINHSNSPNVMMNEFGHLIALTHLFNGEELTIDYTKVYLNN
jgi:hypothetical protein